MLTPSKYWRLTPSGSVDSDVRTQETRICIPPSIATHARPPKVGDGLVMAFYDEVQATGMIKYMGLIKAIDPTHMHVDWSPYRAEIWVDTPSGRNFWKTKDAFGFADTKISGYGLHLIFAELFDGLTVRALASERLKVEQGSAMRSRGRMPAIAPERLEPMEIIGAPYNNPRSGVVYLLKSAYGYKVGRTKNIPARMRAFGVHLPIIYTIPLCVWFEDCVEAERLFHILFKEKRINGEWFALNDEDIEKIRAKKTSFDSEM